MGASNRGLVRRNGTMSYISLFSGAGGLDIGLEQAGFRAASLSDVDPVFCDSLRTNQGWVHTDGKIYFQGAKILNCDIREVSGPDLSSSATTDLVVGGPPCQAFSSSGKQLSVLDPRGALVNEFCRIVDEIKPRMFLFENVRGLVTARSRSGMPGGVIHELKARLEELGYSCRVGLLNAADFGSHQRRVRCFIIGSCMGTAPHFPEPTFHKEPGLFGERWRSLREFLHESADTNEDGFTYPTKALETQLSDLPNGSGLKSRGRAEATRPGGHWGYRQGTFIADLDLPARTVVGSASQDWIRWNGRLRRLTIEEVSKLQGFPKDWVFKGTKSQKFKQVGNAVPSIFGNLLGGVIRDHLHSFPSGKPEPIPLPKTVVGAIEYTKKDHERNKGARRVHLPFE